MFASDTRHACVHTDTRTHTDTHADNRHTYGPAHSNILGTHRHTDACIMMRRHASQLHIHLCCVFCLASSCKAYFAHGVPRARRSGAWLQPKYLRTMWQNMICKVWQVASCKPRSSELSHLKKFLSLPLVTERDTLAISSEPFVF